MHAQKKGPFPNGPKKITKKKKAAGPERPRKKGMQYKEAGTAGP
jgi:hypothetical protein